MPAPLDLHAEKLDALKEIVSLAAHGWASDRERDDALARVNQAALAAWVRLQAR